MAHPCNPNEHSFVHVTVSTPKNKTELTLKTVIYCQKCGEVRTIKELSSPEAYEKD